MIYIYMSCVSKSYNHELDNRDKINMDLCTDPRSNEEYIRGMNQAINALNGGSGSGGGGGGGGGGVLEFLSVPDPRDGGIQINSIIIIMFLANFVHDWLHDFSMEGCGDGRLKVIGQNIMNAFNTMHAIFSPKKKKGGSLRSVQRGGGPGLDKTAINSAVKYFLTSVYQVNEQEQSEDAPKNPYRQIFQQLCGHTPYMSAQISPMDFIREEFDTGEELYQNILELPLKLKAMEEIASLLRKGIYVWGFAEDIQNENEHKRLEYELDSLKMEDMLHTGQGIPDIGTKKSDLEGKMRHWTRARRLRKKEYADFLNQSILELQTKLSNTKIEWLDSTLQTLAPYYPKEDDEGGGAADASLSQEEKVDAIKSSYYTNILDLNNIREALDKIITDELLIISGYLMSDEYLHTQLVELVDTNIYRTNGATCTNGVWKINGEDYTITEDERQPILREMYINMGFGLSNPKLGTVLYGGGNGESSPRTVADIGVPIESVKLSEESAVEVPPVEAPPVEAPPVEAPPVEQDAVQAAAQAGAVIEALPTEAVGAVEAPAVEAPAVEAQSELYGQQMEIIHNAFTIMKNIAGAGTESWYLVSVIQTALNITTSITGSSPISILLISKQVSMVAKLWIVYKSLMKISL